MYTKDNITNLIFSHSNIKYVILRIEGDIVTMNYLNAEEAKKGTGIYKEFTTGLERTLGYLGKEWKPEGYLDQIITNYEIF